MLGAGGEKLTQKDVPRGRSGRTADGQIDYDMNLYIDYVTNM
jgi:hypothetical protein